MCALSKEAAQAGTRLFQDRKISKVYHAIVRGHLGASGIIERTLNNEERGPQASLTHWTTRSTVEKPFAIGRYSTARYSVLELSPKTGRKHQLRRHCAGIGHPVIGDVNHGDRHHNHFFRDELCLPGLFLHARALSFTHPFSSLKMQFTAPYPETWKRAEEVLGWPALTENPTP